MEEIKVGEYVRLARNQGINRITKIDSKKYFLEKDIDDKYGDGMCVLEEYELKDEIIKHSSNIIDLIEVGDYVNGYKVTRIYEDIEKFVQCDYPVEAGITNHYKFYNMAIKSICTKEQFAAVEYKLDN